MLPTGTSLNSDWPDLTFASRAHASDRWKASPPPRLKDGKLLKSEVVCSPFTSTSLSGQNVMAMSPKGTHPRRPLARWSRNAKIDVSKCHRVKGIELLDVDVCFVYAHECSDDPAEAIADPGAHEWSCVSGLMLKRDGHPSAIKTESCQGHRKRWPRAALNPSRPRYPERSTAFPRPASGASLPRGCHRKPGCGGKMKIIPALNCPGEWLCLAKSRHVAPEFSRACRIR